MRFFARPGKYEPCGIFSWGHLALIIVTIIGIKVALKKTVHSHLSSESKQRAV